MLCSNYLHVKALLLSDIWRHWLASKGIGLGVGCMIMVPESIINFDCIQHTHTLSRLTHTDDLTQLWSQRFSMEKISTIGLSPGSRQRCMVHLPCIFGTAWLRWDQQIDGLAIRFDTKLPFLCEFDSHKYKLCVIDNNTCDSSRKTALCALWRHEVCSYMVAISTE